MSALQRACEARARARVRRPCRVKQRRLPSSRSAQKTWSKKLCCWFHGDDIAERLELFHVPSRGVLSVASPAVVASQLVVRDTVAHHIKSDLEDLMARGDDGAL